MAGQAEEIWDGIQAIADSNTKNAIFRYLFGPDYDPAFDYGNLAFGDNQFPELARQLPELIRNRFIIEHAVRFE